MLVGFARLCDVFFSIKMQMKPLDTLNTNARASPTKAINKMTDCLCVKKVEHFLPVTSIDVCFNRYCRSRE
jgi:hypothetical protein